MPDVPAEWELPERTRELATPMTWLLLPKALEGCWWLILFLLGPILDVAVTDPVVRPADEGMIKPLMSVLLMPDAAPFFTFRTSFLPDGIGWPSGMSEWSAEIWVAGLKTI